MKPRIVFMGSPDFAVPTLSAVASGFSVVGVVTQPDRPAGRGKTLTPPPVKVLAQSLGLDLIQPEKLRAPEAFERLAEWQPDLIVVVAFGQILRKNILELPRLGCVNVHASLLPRWRGAAPIQAAILAGDSQAGVTIMKLDAGVDTGDMLAQTAVEIRPEDTAGSLSDRLAHLGAQLLMDVLPAYIAGELPSQPQDPSLATYAGMIEKSAGLLDFDLPAVALARKVRAYNPWPSAFFDWKGATLKIHRAHAQPGSTHPRVRSNLGKLPAVGTSDGWLVLDEVQPAGKTAMPGEVFLRGARDWTGQQPG